MKKSSSILARWSLGPFLLLAALLLCAVPSFGQSTYTWIGSNGLGGDGTWNTAAHWSPSRSSPNAADILQFSLGGSPTITVNAGFTNGSIRVSNSTSVTFTAGAGRTLIVTNVTGDDLIIASNSSITLGTNINMTLASSATAAISGTLTVNSGRTYNTDGTSVVTTVMGTIVNAGTVTSTTAGKLLFNSGSIYQHNQNGGTVPTATWDANSTCQITGITNANPTGLAQSFGHLVWNTPGMTGNRTFPDASTMSIAGNLQIQSTGTGILEFNNQTALSISGNLLISGGTTQLTPNNTARSWTVGGSVTISGGTLDLSNGNKVGTLNVAGNFSITSGTLTETGTGSGAVIFNGSGTQIYTSGGTVSNTINFTVNSGSYLQMADGTTVVSGGGSFTLSSGATLGVTSVDGITTSGATGNIQVTGTRTYSSGAHYIYNGTTAQVTGNGLTQNIPANLTINNSAGVTLSAATTISGNLTIASGAVLDASSSNFNMTVGGNWTNNGGTFTPRAATVTFNGTGAQAINGTAVSQTFHSITVNKSAQTLSFGGSTSSISLSGNLTILAGTFDLGSGTADRISAGGVLTVSNGATLKVGGTGTLPANYSTHSIGATSTVEYNGTTQTIAALNSAQDYGNLIVSSSTSATAGGNVGVVGTLTLNNDLNMGSNTLTLGSAATVTSTGDVVGAVFRSGLATGTAYAFNNQYTTITFSGSAPTNVTSVLTRGAAPSGKSNAIQRYYTISNTGGFGTATLRLRYLDSELNGNTELDLVLWKDVSGTWTEQGRTGSVDVTNNFVELAGVTSFSAWTLANNLLDHFAVSFTSPQTSGVAFTGTNTITAQDAGNRTVTRFNAATNNVTVTATPNDGTITGLGSGNNNVLNQASDFVNGVANVTGSLVFSGLTGNHTFTATSANGKTGTSGTVTINASTTNWVGGTSNNWNDPANWSNGVPGAGTNVVIGSATFRPRVPTTGASTFDLTINNGGYLEWESCGGVLNIYGQLTIVNGGTMDLGTCTPANQVVFHGNFTINNGGAIQAGNGIIDLKASSWQNNPGSSFYPGTSTVIVDGTGNQTISGDITFYNLIVDNPTGTVTFTGDVVVENDMTIEAGSTVDVSGGGTLTVVGDFNNQGSVPTDKPYIVSATAVSTTQVDVTFNEPVQQTSAETASNYSIRLQSGGTLSISSAVRDGTNTAVVHLTPSSALTPGNVDTLVVNNVQDLSGGDVIQANSRKRITSAALNVFYSRASGNWNDVNTWSFVSHVGAAASRLPGSATGDSVIVGNNHTVTLDVNVSNLNLVRVNSTGTLNTGTFVISGSGAFELNAGGTLGIGSADGITASGASGNIQTTTRSFSTGANYTYNGTSAQVTGNGLPSTVNNLTISNAAGVTLTASTSLTGDLTVSSGTFDLGANNANRSSSGGTLTLGAGTTLKIGGTGSLPSNYTAHSINSSSTVEYNGTNQTVAALNSSQNYGTLIISGSGTKTLAGNIGIVNDLTISGGTFDLSTFTANRTVSGGSLTLSSGTALTVGGSSGGLTGSNFPANFSALTLDGTVEYNGTGAQSVAPLAYTHVLFSNGGTKTIDGTITFNGNFTVNAGAVVVVAATGDIQINGNLVVGGSFTNNGTISIGN